MLFLAVFSVIICLQDTVLAGNPKKLISYSLADNRPLKKALGYDEDVYFNFTELSTKYGFLSEEHSVTTEDGYILGVFRIPSTCNTTNGYPVILMHGLLDSSDAWIVAGPKVGLGYILSSNCYDVWAANGRGTAYSRNHVKLDPNKDAEYWNYSFDENGKYDLPAIVDYVINATDKPKVYYVGHSQGTTDFYVMGALRPEYNKKIHLSVSLAPIAYMKHMKSLLLLIIAQQTDLLKDTLDEIGFAEIFGKHQLIHSIVEKVCQIAPEPICGTALSITTGYKHESISSKTLSVAFGHLLAGISSKTLAHFGQLIVSQKFQRYDEGKEGNKVRYGGVKPPEYNLTLVTSPLLLVCGKNDWVSSLEDVNELSARLPNMVEEYVVPDPSWSHNNHLWGVNAPKYVFSKILAYFKEYDLR
ncbi:unnamed protein product [Leptosia nina]|uniref:Lipase n=1 Tax=Leptosia nina TaxID=320188 RepID=A0AAV1JFA2_9NEOP